MSGARIAVAHTTDVSTRWDDNDVYGHMNHVRHYALFDTVINRWLIEEGGLDIHAGEVIGICAESGCRFLLPLAFPEDVSASLQVAHVGRSSVRYELELLKADGRVGWFVHVFVRRDRRTPTAIPEALRASLERLMVPAGAG